MLGRSIHESRDPRDVLDVGAGAGALTQVLRTAGHRVTAAEPSASMVTELVRSVGVPTVRAAAERLPFSARSFDAVTVGSAFHWFAEREALPELARVLRPAGTLALAWNIREETTDFDRRLGELLTSAQPATLHGDWGTSSVAAAEASSLFGTLDSAEFPVTQRLNRVGVIGLVASRSYVETMPDRPRAQLLDRAGQLFDDAVRAGDDRVPGGDAASRRPDAGTTAPTIKITYRTSCWRTQRR
jgi:SAM-dependent methyltransferase